ncbi:MAG: YfcE family phosphodiesterase [Pseudomonadales bacterium]|nr:YfcE family phosphodiesterase [Pseudomonadales bacterium]
MRIGVVSDTHNNLRNTRRIVELFNEAGVARVIHTGDITQPKTLDVLARLHAPLFGVWGNNDLEELHRLEPVAAAHGFFFSHPPLQLYWNDRSIIVVHDPREFQGNLADHHQLALHGHTHMQVIERSARRLLFNPGECAGHMSGRNVVGVVDLERLHPELLWF